MAEDHSWLIFNPQLPSQPHRRALGLFSAAVPRVCSGWILTSLPSSRAGSVAMSLQSLPLPSSCAEISSPLSLLLGSSSLLFPRSGCSSAPVGRSCTNRDSPLSTGPRPARVSSPGRFLLLFHQTNNLVRLLLLLIFCSLAQFHAPFCSQRCLS